MATSCINTNDTSDIQNDWAQEQLLYTVGLYGRINRDLKGGGLPSSKYEQFNNICILFL